MNLSTRLAEPIRTLTPQELAENWFEQVISIRIANYAILAQYPNVLNKVRGALGRDLIESASPEAVAGKPCPWSPPCALDVFFREQLRIGRQGLPKPLVLGMDAVGRDLRLYCRVFGLACDWSQIIRDRLVAVVRDKVEWGKALPGYSLNRPEIAHVSLSTHEGWKLEEAAPHNVSLSFITPLNVEPSFSLDTPWSLLKGLIRRVSNLARWQDSALVIEVGEMDDYWPSLEYDLSGLKRELWERHMGRDNKNIQDQSLSGYWEISGDLSPLWPFLIIGQSCHMGGGAVQGLGRYEMIF